MLPSTPWIRLVGAFFRESAVESGLKSGVAMFSRRLFHIFARIGLLAILAGLSACDDTTGLAQRALAPIPAETLALMEQVGTTKDAPTLIRAYKKEAEFEVWKMRPDGRYVHLKTYPICRWSGQLGPKVREGDRQAPEGFYSISPGQLNPNSNYYLSFNVGYPNAYDRAWGHTGGLVMVHGICSSAGCFSMTDRQIAEIYAVVRASLNGGQNAVQMQSYPFHMTAENFARHRLDPHIAFWKELKEGADHFEATKQEPVVGVCGKRYVFDAVAADGRRLDPSAACPPLTRDPQTEALVAEKRARDEAKIAELVSSGVRPIRLVYQDGGQHPAFTARVADVSRPEALTPPIEIALDEKPIPAAGKAVSKLATKTTPATVAAASASARANKDGGETAVATSVKSSEPEGTVKLAALASQAASTSKGAIGDWLGLHKEPERAPAAEPMAEPAPHTLAPSKKAPLAPVKASTPPAKDAGKKTKDAGKKTAPGPLQKVARAADAQK